MAVNVIVYKLTALIAHNKWLLLEYIEIVLLLSYFISSWWISLENWVAMGQ